MADLVAGQQHRRSLGQQQGREEIALLLPTLRNDRRVVGWAFDTEIEAQILRMAVLVILLIGFVVLLVVRDQIGQRESVMRSDEIDAGPGAPAAMVEQIGRSADACGKLWQHMLIAAPIAPYRIPVAIVPFRPAWREVAKLIASRPDVPGFRDQLYVLQGGGLSHRIEESAAGIESVILPPDGGGKIETETVDMHLFHPVGEGVQNQLQDARMR